MAEADLAERPVQQVQRPRLLELSHTQVEQAGATPSLEPEGLVGEEAVALRPTDPLAARLSAVEQVELAELPSAVQETMEHQLQILTEKSAELSQVVAEVEEERSLLAILLVRTACRECAH